MDASSATPKQPEAFGGNDVAVTGASLRDIHRSRLTQNIYFFPNAIIICLLRHVFVLRLS